MFLGTTIRWGERAQFLPDDEPTPTGGDQARQIGWGMVVPALCAYGVLFIFQAGEIQLGALGSESEQVKYYNSWDKSYLPETLGAGWVQGDSNFQKRDSDNPYGAHSRTWKYRNKQGLNGLISFDYPFPEWHDLRYCYTSAGWAMEKTDTFDVRTAPDARLECVRFDLRKPFEERGYCWFTEFDQVGRPIPIQLPDLSKTYAQSRWEERFSSVRDRWLSLIGKGAARPSFMDVLQVQVMVDHPGQLSPEQKEQCQQFFEQAAELIRRKCVAGLPGRPKS
jgi:hypothetical protein